VKEQNRTWIDIADPTGANTFEKSYATYNLPVIYILDKDKRILRKRIKAEELGDLLSKFYKK
jgi:hypothetical protein